ncbi:MAG: protoporphyrinogen/coproporphyrinogen oxidase [Gemmatimonadota bacterium]
MIGIVGGGLTGLALAHELAKRGVEHVVLEAADRPGGVIRSEWVEGRILEFGPQRTRMTGALAALVAELGLEREVVYAQEGLPLYVYADGALREVPFSLRSLVTGDLLSWRGKLRLAWEPLTAGPRDDERVSALLTRKLGREAYERLAGPLYGGLYASDPADMVVGLSLARTLVELGVRRSFLFRLLARGGSIAPPAACSFRDGLQTLTDALHAAHRGSVRLGSAVRGLRRSPAGWAIELEGREVEAEAVVLTCEAPAAGRILAGVAPDAADRLARLVYNPLAVVHLGAPDAGLRGLGYQVALGEDLATRGATWNESLFGRLGIHTAFLGGAARPEAVHEPDDRLGEIAAGEFRSVTGREARALRVTRVRMPAWDATWRALEGLAPPRGIRFAANWESRPGIAGRLQRARTLAREL